MDGEPTYTVYIRLPFPRGDFVDPPPVKWDASKDESLWRILSGVAKTEIDWVELAARFEVTVDFLLQQVTYLTERHASQVRAQMRKATAAARSSAAPSPIPGSDSNAALEAMRRTGSSQGAYGHTRAPSSLSIRKDSPMPKNDGTAPDTPKIGTSAAGAIGRPQASRNSSSGTTAQVGSAGSTAGSLRLKPGAIPTSPRSQNRQRLPSLPTVTSSAANPSGMASAAPQAMDPPSPGPADSPSPTSSASSSPAQSRIIRRPPRFQQKQQDQDGIGSAFADDDDDDEAEPAFLPYRAKASTSVEAGGSSGDGSGQYTDPSATLRGDPRDFASNAARRLQNVTGPDHSGQGKGKGKETECMLQKSSNSDSSESSAAFMSKPSSSGRRQPSGPLSPRRTTELKQKGYSREGSDGTPSMGSSFSDLDDASVTQSALEEALASKMQGGNTIGSTISNVFRSRYLPK
ncbi:hypothetical protein J7T55_011964 [Diaporthe amygdali]|uniref:uncharacterized protein n=1 Tax=Phomopsis amygdali TaxID=1214568 RepID=UPI0022FECB29|nr:uncharacterized protein J7T55_011964 [Diaporthe amygdali]KAJ0123499.1 hypothetical protein J7T55_011964 [Diaporthe amygdali]